MSPFTIEQMETGRRKAIERRKRDSQRLTELVVKLIKAGHTQSEIAWALNKKRQSINRIVQRARRDRLLDTLPRARVD